jgi:hypothetical protein
MAKITSRKLASLLPPVWPKRRPRGSHDHEAWRANQFKPGQSGNPGGKPKVLQKFSARVSEEMMKDAPPALRKALGLKRGATMFDAMMSSAVTQAASGDLNAFVVMRETLEGKLPVRSLNVSADLADMLNNSQFTAWLTDKFGEFNTLRAGEEHGNHEGPSLTFDVPALPERTDEPED